MVLDYSSHSILQFVYYYVYLDSKMISKLYIWTGEKFLKHEERKIFIFEHI